MIDSASIEVANSFVENAWYVVCMSDEIKANEIQGHRICKKPIVVWRTTEGKVVAFDDRCVHKRMPLSCGKILPDGNLQCAYHGFTYNGNGQCVMIPSQIEQPIPSRAKLKPYPVIEQDGVVWVWPGTADRMGKARPPRTPEFVDENFES